MDNSWVDETFPFFELIRIFYFYLDMECWLVSLTSKEDRHWHPIRHHSRPMWPVDFDDRYGLRDQRDRFNQRLFTKVLKEKRTACAPNLGLWGFFVPIFRGGKVIGFLQSGVFLRNQPDRAQLLAQWKALTGMASPEADPEFLHYVRVFLQTPVLDAPARKAVQEVLELGAGFFSGRVKGEAFRRRSTALKNELFAKRFPHTLWSEHAIRQSMFYPPTWWLGRLAPWEKEEMGIQEVPTVVVSLSLDGGQSSGRDDLDRVLRAYRFQRQAVAESRKIPNTVVSMLEDYGVIVFTSPTPGLSPLKAKAELERRVRDFCLSVGRRFKTRVLAGIGRGATAGESLSQAYHESLAALGLCQALDKPLLFFEDVPPGSAHTAVSKVYELSRRMVDACAAGSLDETRALASQRMRAAVARSSGRLESIRLHLLNVLRNATEALQKRMPLETEKLMALAEDWERGMQGAEGITRLAGIFQDATKILADLAVQPAKGLKHVRLEAARRYVEANFQEDLNQAEMARRNGFSVSDFSRQFKRAAGMGFSAYLRQRRVAHAKKLLMSTQLPMAQVAREAGFNNFQYFFHVFKADTGKTPLDFRNTIRSAAPPRDSAASQAGKNHS